TSRGKSKCCGRHLEDGNLNNNGFVDHNNNGAFDHVNRSGNNYDKTPLSMLHPNGNKWTLVPCSEIDNNVNQGCVSHFDTWPGNLGMGKGVYLETPHIDFLICMARSGQSQDEILSRCEAALLASDVNNITESYLIAAKYGMTHVMDALIGLIRDNFIIVSQTKQFLELPVDLMELFLSDTFVNVHDELDVFAAALRWIDYNKQERLAQSGRILNCIRYERISPIDIRDHIEPNIHLFNGPCGAEALVNIYRRHALLCYGVDETDALGPRATHDEIVQEMQNKPATAPGRKNLSNIQLARQELEMENNITETLARKKSEKLGVPLQRRGSLQARAEGKSGGAGSAGKSGGGAATPQTTRGALKAGVAGVGGSNTKTNKNASHKTSFRASSGADIHWRNRSASNSRWDPALKSSGSEIYNRRDETPGGSKPRRRGVSKNKDKKDQRARGSSSSKSRTRGRSRTSGTRKASDRTSRSSRPGPVPRGCYMGQKRDPVGVSGAWDQEKGAAHRPIWAHSIIVGQEPLQYGEQLVSGAGKPHASYYGYDWNENMALNKVTQRDQWRQTGQNRYKLRGYNITQ
ncbi:hypothetical protein EGW08_003126, partial [Elysia chlorotica]